MRRSSDVKESKMKRSIITIVTVVLASALAVEVANASVPVAPPAEAAATQVDAKPPAVKLSARGKATLKRAKTNRPRPVSRVKRSNSQGIALLIGSDHNYNVYSGETNWFWSAYHGLYVKILWWYSEEIGACLGVYRHWRYLYWTGSGWEFLEAWQYCGGWRRVN